MAQPLNLVSRDRVLLPCAIIVALAAATVLAGCGRKGPLEPPPSAAAPATGETGKPQPIMAPDGRPTAPAGERKRIPLDWLID